MCGIAICSVCLGGLTFAQGQSGGRDLKGPTGLPVNQPTIASPAYTPAAAYVAPTPSAPKRAQITYTDTLLTVSATNSSLNQILREIARQTGMKITGGVNDERVFGTYGPAAPAKVLATLLDGTGSNVLIVQSPADGPVGPPVELVLTPRHGGPTPPNPNAPGFSDGADRQGSSPVGPVPPLPPYAGPSQIQPASASTPVPGTPPASADTPAGPATTQDQSPNGVKTPQQIYEQLLRLRQQSQQPQQQ